MMKAITEIFLPYIQIRNDSIEKVDRQLQLINENLSALIEATRAQSFWDSQLFAAIIGASSAIIVLLIQQLWTWRRKKNERLGKIYLWIADQYVFWSPKTLVDNASGTTYGSTTTDYITGKEEQIPEKPLGEKMVIELRSRVKYWQFPSYQLRRAFKKYENTLLNFNKCESKSCDELSSCLSKADSVFRKIQEKAFKETGENEWTI